MPISAEFLSTYHATGPNGELLNYVRFNVAFKDDGSESRFLNILVDGDEAKMASLKNGKDYADSELTDWMIALFNAWKANKTNSKAGDTYTFSETIFGMTQCVLETSDSPSSNPHEQRPTLVIEDEDTGCSLSAIPTIICEAFSSAASSVYSFFAEPELSTKNFYNFNDGNYATSKFQPNEVAMIVDRINQLEREKHSRWSMNHDKKDIKIKGFTQLLDESAIINPSWSREGAIAKVLEDNPGMIDGNWNFRSLQLLEKLQNPETNTINLAQ